MTFSAAPGGSTRSKARSALEKGDAVADQLGEAFPVLGKYPRDLPWARGRRCLCRTGLFAFERGTALPNRAVSVVGEHPGGLNDTGTDAGSFLNAVLAGSAPPQADGIVR
jgi:hypothetical protein